MNQIKFEAYRRYDQDATDLFLIDYERRLQAVIKDGYIQWEPVAEGSIRKPLLTFAGALSRDWQDTMMKLLVELNTPQPAKQYLEGKVEAQEKHLEDMRKLVFNNKENNVKEIAKG